MDILFAVLLLIVICWIAAQSVVLSELREEIARLDQDDLENYDALESDIGKLEGDHVGRTEVSDLWESLAELEQKLNVFERAHGPVWTTKDGFFVTPSMMSDNHLEEAVKIATSKAKAAFQREIERRNNDDGYYAAKGAKSPRVRIAVHGEAFNDERETRLSKRIDDELDGLAQRIRALESPQKPTKKRKTA